MIVPWLKGFLSWEEAPLTWALVFLNIFVYLMTFEIRPSAQQDLINQEGLELTGRIYSQYVKVETDDTKELKLLGLRGLRDGNFVFEAEKHDFNGDQVQISEWKKNLITYRDRFQNRMVYLFGLKLYKSKPLSWITYQFMHHGIIHLLSNMIFLIVFSSALEMMYGGIFVLGLYLLSGLAGGLGFVLMSYDNLVPMIGASASLSGMMTFYMVTEKKKRVRFLYFFAPIESYYGFIYLPTLMILPLNFLTDVASYLAASPQVGTSVAYTAHIGGGLLGILFGLWAKFLNFSPIPLPLPFSDSDENDFKNNK